MSSFSVSGNNNGVITLTTPTLTPTTMRNIEQASLLDSPYIDHDDGGSFIPPLPTTLINVVTNNWQGGSISTKQEPVDMYEDSDEKDLKVSSKKVKGVKSGKGNRSGGGRRPKMDKNASPEEEERRRLRRERNKMAAARCRKRRVDHTNSLMQETQSLESQRGLLQGEITSVQQTIEELQFILKAHNPNCTKMNNNNNNNNTTSNNNNNNTNTSASANTNNNAQSYTNGTGGSGGPTINNNIINSSLNSTLNQGVKPKRPTSLPVAVIKQESLVTPSSGLDLDWASLPPTGLTPNFTPITPSVNLLSLMEEDLTPKANNKKNNLVQL